MAPDNLMLAALLTPLIGVLGIWLCGRMPNVREGVTLLSSLVLLYLVAQLLPIVLAGVSNPS